nr:PREDICTED: glutamate receptor ionotropic, kainate 2-like isoform X1 [Bemisia tabaci]
MWCFPVQLRFLFHFLVIILNLGSIHGKYTAKIVEDPPPREIGIAGLFGPEDSIEERSFRMAIDRINLNKNILPDVKLVPKIGIISETDSFNTSRTVCNLAAEGIAAVFGPNTDEVTGIVHSVCDTLDLPHIKTHWDISNEPLKGINIHPNADLLAQALIDTIEDMDWNTFTIVYENTEGLIRLQEVLKKHQRVINVHGHAPVTIKQLPEDADYRPLFKEILQSSENHIVLDCRTDLILDVLRQAKEVKMMGDYQSYILTSLDAHTLDYSEFTSTRTNITSLRLVNPNSTVVQYALQDWASEEQRLGIRSHLTADSITVEAALIHDAVYLFAEALHMILGTEKDLDTQSLQCGTLSGDAQWSGEKWLHGFKLSNFMKLLDIEGMTGPMRFNSTTGSRTYFELEISEILPHLKKIGSWDPLNKIKYTRTRSEMYEDIVQAISNKTFIVTSRLGEPYLMLREEDGLEGNDRFRGYSIDLIDAISKDLGFKYRFELVPDGNYGSLNKQTKKWNGLIKELQDMRADLAICDLTITYERRTAVDFTMPFMTLGISILYSKPEKQEPDLFSFLSPLSLEVWIFMATAYLGVSILLFILARCTPNEWENPHPCEAEPEELENALNLNNCLWFSLGSVLAQGCDILPKITPSEWNAPHPCSPDPEELENKLNFNNLVWHNCGSLMQQGSDIAPQAVSTRLVAGMWWFFTLIMISSYTANLAAFLTKTGMETTISSVEDLAKQSKVKYGCLLGGSTGAFFSSSNDSLYQKMWSVMESTRPSVFVKTNAEGVDRVMKGKGSYAFFMESTSIEYQVERNCENLMQVGGLLDSKGYGIAMPFNSPYRTAISGSVLKLQESGGLRELKDKWWKVQGQEECVEGEQEDSQELGIANVGGVFVVLILGCSFAFFFALLEFLWNVRKVAVEEKLTLMEAFMVEVKFVLSCSENKPVRRRPESEMSNEMDTSFMQLNAKQ